MSIGKVRHLAILLIAMLALTLVVAACSSADDDEDTTATDTTTDTTATDTTAAEEEMAEEAAEEEMAEVAEAEEAAEEEMAEVAEAEEAAEEEMAMADQPVRGGTLRVGIIDSGSLDPAVAGLSVGEAPYSELTYDNLVGYDYDGVQILPDVLTSWEISEDLTTYTWHLKEGVMFHHGPELKAADVKFTLDRVLDPATASPVQGQIAFIENVTVLDDYTLEVKLGGPNTALVGLMTDYHIRLVPDGITNDEITTGEWGSGPYTLFEHLPAERTVFKRYDTYWKGTGYPDEIVFFYMPESITRTEALKSGTIDAFFTPDIATIDELQAHPDIELAQTPTGGLRAINMHVDRAPFDNKDLRKAMQYAVDRDFVREATQFGLAVNMNDHPVWVNDPLYWADQPIIKQDIELAKEYLAKAGYPDGFEIDLHAGDMGQMLDMALAFSESVKDAGINVNVVNHDTSTFWEEVWINECCPFVTVTWGYRPAAEMIGVMLATGQVWNDSHYTNPRLDELLDMANATADVELKRQYLQEAQEILIDDAPNLYMMHVPSIIPHRTNIGGVRAAAGKSEIYMDEWYIKPE